MNRVCARYRLQVVQAEHVFFSVMTQVAGSSAGMTVWSTEQRCLCMVDHLDLTIHAKYGPDELGRLGRFVESKASCSIRPLIYNVEFPDQFLYAEAFARHSTPSLGMAKLVKSDGDKQRAQLHRCCAKQRKEINEISHQWALVSSTNRYPKGNCFE